MLTGIATCLWSPALASQPWLWSALLIGALLWWRGRAVRWIGALAFGFALAGLHAAHALSLQLPVDWEKREVTVQGRVVELPEHQSRRTAFAFRVSDTSDQPAPLRGRLLQLSWYDDYDGAGTGRDRLLAGQQWQLTARVRAPRGLRNPGGFDSEKRALERRLAASGYVGDPEAARLLAPASGLDAWRESMSSRIAGAVEGGGARFIRALALGDTRGLDDADWQVLRANGLTHLVAISGFHVGLVAGFFALVVAGIWWLWPALGRRCPRPVAAAVAGLAGAMLYAAVAGFALPTVRTVLMIAVVAGLRVFRRSTSTFDSLALAAIAILLVDPLAVLGAGFWLSFFGVAWLLWCLPGAGRRPLRDLVSAQGVATLGLLPLSVVLFGQASLVGPLANLLAVPWWSLVVVPLALLGTALEALGAGLGAWPWQLAAWCFERSWSLFEWLADSDLALWWLAEPAWFAMPLAMLGAFWLLLPRGLPGRPLALLLWLPLLLPARHLPARGEAELRVLDVGQGLSVLVRTAHHSLLYDMGPAMPAGFDAGERVVLPALRALGVGQLDLAVVSHGDNDHAGGFDAVRRAVPVGAAYAPEGAPLVGTRPCVAGRAWQWDGVDFRFLHPPPYFPYLGNEASCVLRIQTAHGTALLTGDIGEVIERDLVRRAELEPATSIRAEVVLVAHHGSASASDPGFIVATGARFALVSNGHGNRFGHPKADVMARWHHAGAETRVTSEGGALTVRLVPGGPAVETRRRAHPRLWDAARRTRQAPAAAPAGLSYRPD
ncbi:DNA internalization-related competence protein ComEC/Rec2 [Novilysobacter erysipheiresistens]|uniref:DNA internalization-related competence protein ComEC/Rec2 n=1 Tax=Novilysobacter erysipheiresistens TaxID=1749332 RepID=A0ABU7Z0N6_9GAMM